jgi:hypothetical protein
VAPALPPTSTTSGQALRVKRGSVALIEPGSYDAAASHYPRVVNASVHPTVAQFFGLTRSQMVARYVSLHPEVAPETLSALLRTPPRHFRWAGCDLFVCGPRRRTVVVETNSCPSGQKSLPFKDGDELNGYGRLMRTAFDSLLPRAAAAAAAAAPGAAPGVFAVMYDKNEMEARGYAGALAELTGERVYLAEFYLTDPDPPLRWDAARRLSVRAPSGEWLPVKAALRYVTQKPWTRMPVVPATPLLNPLLPCLAGGRNKMLAARAYDALNARLAASGTPLRLLTPHTLGDICKADVPSHVQAMGGCAVVKVPYGNAGQGVYTITCASELEAFMAESHGCVGGKRGGAPSALRVLLLLLLLPAALPPALSPPPHLSPLPALSTRARTAATTSSLCSSWWGGACGAPPPPSRPRLPPQPLARRRPRSQQWSAPTTWAPCPAARATASALTCA